MGAYVPLSKPMSMGIQYVECSDDTTTHPWSYVYRGLILYTVSSGDNGTNANPLF